MAAGIAYVVGHVTHDLGMVVLLLSLALFTFIVSGAAFLVDESLQQRHGFSVALPGVELLIVPLGTMASAHWRFGWQSLNALRSGRAGLYFPLLMSAALAGLFSYLVWSWTTPLSTVGPDEFGVVRWVGLALAAAFALIWLPLFPRVTATLAGMIAGPALVAVVAFVFFGVEMQTSSSGPDGSGGAALFVGLVATPLWMVGAIWLSQGGRTLLHAAWGGGLMLCLAIWGVNY